MSASIPDVCFVTDLVRILRTSRATIDRLRRARTFPIAELPGVDKRPRWSGAAVRRFLETGQRSAGGRTLGRAS